MTKYKSVFFRHIDSEKLSVLQCIMAHPSILRQSEVDTVDLKIQPRYLKRKKFGRGGGAYEKNWIGGNGE